jgi:pimeloyl-ACP methyl ester carboxylesterase
MMYALSVKVAIALALTAPTPASASSATTAPARGAEQPRFESTACPASVPSDPTITCGSLTVPEDRARPNGRTLRLFVSRLASRSPAPRPDPVLILQGGPGETPDPAAFVDHPLRDERDVIILDQRGTGRSQPSLACPEVNDAELEALGRDSNAEAANRRAYARAARACRKRLISEGVRLRAYNTTANAADVADLRTALAIQEWNLAGNSYGTRLALTVLRDHSEGVRSASLGGPYPPQVDEQAELITRTQGAFDAFFAADPDLRATFEQLTDRLDTDPVTVTVTDPKTGRPTTVRFDGHRLAVLLRGALYFTELLPALPQLISQLARGEGFEAVATESLTRTQRAEAYSWGMYYSVHCQEEIAFTNRKADATAAKRNPRLRGLSLAATGLADTCREWDVGRAPPRVKKPVSSSIPTVILVGAYDPATPPAWARVTARTLAHAFVFEFPNVGHDATTVDCVRRIRNAFLDDPTTRPSNLCAGA